MDPSDGGVTHTSAHLPSLFLSSPMLVMKSRDSQDTLEIDVAIDQAGGRMSARRHSISLPDGRQLAI